ncbi:Homeodomain-interacting protein kinase 3 [Merluccius polli]|uniref:Homeodomain-interacting protein kinase 3 n=1 Tax=Merluccius polli TaxID=89951 RepID=A0AA47MPD8_MERPO|nr:Homeodomain-interacting protein kinase 3 [Merluccius polli]
METHSQKELKSIRRAKSRKMIKIDYMHGSMRILPSAMRRQRGAGGRRQPSATYGVPSRRRLTQRMNVNLLTFVWFEAACEVCWFCRSNPRFSSSRAEIQEKPAGCLEYNAPSLDAGKTKSNPFTSVDTVLVSMLFERPRVNIIGPFISPADTGPSRADAMPPPLGGSELVQPLALLLRRRYRYRRRYRCGMKVVAVAGRTGDARRLRETDKLLQQLQLGVGVDYSLVLVGVDYSLVLVGVDYSLVLVGVDYSLVLVGKQTVLLNRMSHLVKDFCVEEQEVLYGTSSHYLVESFRGEGSFGKVATCLNMDTRQTVAIKILKKSEEDMVGAEEEIAMLQQILALDPDAYNIVRWFEHFVHRGHTRLVFEMLDISLFDYMNARHLQPLSLLEMSLITQQLAVSFEALKVMGVIHADLKGDNIMFVNQRDKPLKVKLIDFGLAVPICEVELGDTLQALPYRAPEVVLGLPISEAIDIWSLGCVIASMFLGAHLYPSCRDEYELLTCIMDTHGLPSERMLEYGVKSHWYFTKDQGSLNNGWRLKTPEEFYGGPAIERDRDPGCSLDDFMDFLPSLYPEEDEEVLVEFVELLKGMLEVDPHRRMNPSNILQHPFVSLLPTYYGHKLERILLALDLNLIQKRLEMDPKLRITPSKMTHLPLASMMPEHGDDL